MGLAAGRAETVAGPGELASSSFREDQGVNHPGGRVTEPVKVTLYNDAGCPWGYSAHPALRALEWRYGSQLDWRLVLIGLTEHAQQYVDRGYTPLGSAEGYARRFRRFGMPFAPAPRARWPSCGGWTRCWDFWMWTGPRRVMPRSSL